jgi:adenylate cyclase
LDIQRELIKFNGILAKKGLKEFRVGIGISTGSLVAGYIGSTRTMSYSVIGDTVNTASRICSAAKANQIIISQATYDAVSGDFRVKALEPIKAKGKYKPVKVFQVTGEK